MHSFDDYFVKNELKNNQWIRNPFTFNLDSMDDADMQKDGLIDLQSKALLKQGFSNQNLDEVWYSQIAAYPVLAKKALSALMPFATSYLCESGFSILVSMKTKARNRLDARHDMRLALSKTVPRISVSNSHLIKVVLKNFLIYLFLYFLACEELARNKIILSSSKLLS
jgi:hypothetical protein